MARHHLLHLLHPGKARFLCLFFSLFLTLMGTAIPRAVSAYQFFHIESGGAFLPLKWRTFPADFLVDNGPTDILAEIQTAVDTWNNVATAQNVLGTLTRAPAGDFTLANAGTAWGKGILTGTGGADGQQEVVFDEDGSILTALGLSPAEILGIGLTRDEVVGGQGEITDGLMLLNGLPVGGSDRQATEVHEFGHVLGLAHSSVAMHHSSSPPSDALDPINVNSAPTMHPFSLPDDTRGRTLEADDIAGISDLYPEASFFTTFGGIEGTVTRCFTDDPVLGVNVRAVSTTNPNFQITRYSAFDGNAAARFIINGLSPGSYRLLIEAMGANGFTSGRMAILTRVDADFPTEYHNPPDEDDCTEEIPDTPINVAVSAGTTTINKDFKVGAVDLAFVVDDTGSMGPEIGAVRTTLANFVEIMRGLNETLGIPFPNTAIVTFKDDVTKRLISNDPDRLQTAISALTADGGGDCPESSNAALLAAGRLLRKGGVAMLFTDADSRPDGPSRGAVTDLFRSKSMTLSTLLSGTCSDRLAPAPSLAGPARGWEEMGAGASENPLRKFPPEPTLGPESALRTFSEISVESGGFFTAIPGIKTGDPAERERYINTGTNLAVSSAVPAVGLVTPGDGPQGSTLNVEITGANTNFQTSSVVSFAGNGIAVNSQTVNSATRIIANLSIAPGAALGFRDVTVTTDLGGGVTETATGVGAFRVVAPPAGPTILGVVPSLGAQGETLDVSISGANTNFVDGVSVANFGPGITVNFTTVTSPTSAVANLTIDGAAAIGFRDVRVTTNEEIADEAVLGPFLVTAPPPLIPRIASVNPSEGGQGQTLDIAITGENTNFVDGVSFASFSGTGITVNRTTVTSPTSAEANITIAPDAPLGFRDVFVTTGDEVAALLSGFNVTAGGPPAPLFSLRVIRAGTGRGTVRSVPAGINCGLDCVERYRRGTRVTLKPLPDPGSTFAGWRGHADCSDGQVLMNANKGCAALFAATPIVPSFALRVTKAGTGSGTVTSNPAGIDCGVDCLESYPRNTVVTLTPLPDAGSTFAGWRGDADCSDGQVTMNANKGCQAFFFATPVTPLFTLRVTRAGTGRGTVTSSPGGINCGVDCLEPYPRGTVATLTPTPAPGSVFAGWRGDADCSDGRVIMNTNKGCAALFTLTPGMLSPTPSAPSNGVTPREPGGFRHGR